MTSSAVPLRYAYVDKDTGHKFALRIVMNLPLPGVRRSSLEVDELTHGNICKPLSDTAITAVIRNAGTRIGVMRVALDQATDALPPALARVFRVCGTSRASAPLLAGFFMYAEHEPCVLEYMCIKEDFRAYQLGSLLLRTYEEHVRASQCSTLYAAALNDERVFNFYRQNQYTVLDEAGVRARMDPPGQAWDPAVTSELSLRRCGTAGPVRIKLPFDTTLIVKDFAVVAAPVAPSAFATDVIDDDEYDDLYVLGQEI